MQRFILPFLLSSFGLAMLFAMVEEVNGICRVGSFLWVSRVKK